MKTMGGENVAAHKKAQMKKSLTLLLDEPLRLLECQAALSITPCGRLKNVPLLDKERKYVQICVYLVPQTEGCNWIWART